MSDDLVKHLRHSKGWPTLGNAAADRIEALIAERDRAAQEARALALQEVRQALRDDRAAIAAIQEDGK